MQTGSFATLEEVLYDITTNVDDRDFKKGLERGWYISKIKEALEEMAMDSYYEVLTQDFDIDADTLSLQLPDDAFNIREIYFHNGVCCNPSSAVLVRYKRLYNTKGTIKGSTEARTETAFDYSDPFMYRGIGLQADTLYYANSYNGLLMFSPSASGFSKVRIVYNGLGGIHGAKPVIPRLVKSAVIDYVEEAFWRSKKADEGNKSARVHWMDAYQKLNSYTGNWEKAKIRVKKNDRWIRDNMAEYLSRGNW